jgi:hypothetical protein
MGAVATYSPTCTGSPAREAYATAWGTTTAAVVRPASRSQRSQARR